MTCRGAAVPLLLAAWLAAMPAESPGCGVAPRDHEWVNVSAESALIVWDSSSKTEHFVRRATFEGTAYDFGFLVPTPSRPEVKEADDTLYADLSRLTAPKTVYETREIQEEVGFGCGGNKFAANDLAAGKSAAMPASARAGGVAVLEQGRVGDLDYAVLEFKAGADEPAVAAAALLKWLNDHGYVARPDITDWVKVYARDGWVMTAFKIAGRPPTPLPDDGPAPPKTDPKEPARPRRAVTLSSTAVRMSFKAERPFYPYREPAGQRADKAQNTPRLLRVFVASDQRVAGKLGNDPNAWPGRAVWSDVIPDGSRLPLLAKAKLAPQTGPAKWWLTEFEDHSSPRPGTDEVYFEPAADRAPLHRPPHVITNYVTVRVRPWWYGPVVVGVPLALAVLGLVVVRQFLRAK